MHKLKRYGSAVIIAAGFGAMLVLLMVLMCVWLITIDGNNRQLHAIVNQQRATEFILTMRDSAHKRALVLHRMAIVTDPFQLDEQNMILNARAGDFVAARDQLLAMDLNEDYRSIWASIQPHVATNAETQNQVARLVMTDQIEEAKEMLHLDVIPKQDMVINELSTLLTGSGERVQKALADIASYNRTAYLLVSILGIATLLLGSLTAFLVTRKAKNTERVLIQAQQAETSANQLKSQFLANMSHEIRTPLTAIIGFAETSLDDDMPKEERKHAIHAVVRSGRHLLRIINEILDLSKIESNQLEVERIKTPLAPILADVESVIGMQAREKGLDFAVHCEHPLPGTIKTDPTRLKQILLNLCSNAVKFTHQGSVELAVHLSKKEEQLYFSVIDTGIGMTREQQTKLFKPFSQADVSTTRRFGGTGLGLYISKQLAEKLGGTIAIQQRTGKGTIATVKISTGPIDHTMPCSEVMKGQEDSIYSADQPSVKMLSGRILIAEDSPDNQKLISIYLKKTGVEIDIANNGKEAVEKALASDYDLVLMDMQMPVMDGVEATQTLRSLGFDTPIIALTANAMKKDRESYQSAGCNAFLSKPIETAQFYHTLGEFLPEADIGTQLNQEMESQLEFDPDLMELATDFINSLQEREHAMRTFLQQGDWEGLRSVAHKLKGIAGSFGFPIITEQAADIENQIKSERYESLEEKLQTLHISCEKATNQYKSYTNGMEQA